MKNKKTILLIIGGVILIVIIALVIWQVYLKKSKAQTANTVPVFKADFLQADEKQKLGIPVDLKIEALSRDAQGGVMVYKVIKQDSDVVDPAKLNPISPRTK